MSETIFAKGSPAARVCEHLHTHAGVLLSRRDLANLLQIVPGAVDAAIEPAVVAGWVVSAHDADTGRYWKAGPNMRALQVAGAVVAGAPTVKAAQAPALRAPTLAAPPAKQRRNPRLPRLDMTNLVVTKGEPPPVAQARKGSTMHDPLFDKLAQDGDVIKGIAVAYRGSLSKAVQTYLDYRPALKAKSAILVRTIDANTIGLWRVPRTDFPGRKSSLKAA
jgi:hypothetical protein